MRQLPSLHMRLVDATRGIVKLQFADIFERVVVYAAGKPINVVNPEVLERSD